jgi:hypothetical protein
VDGLGAWARGRGSRGRGRGPSPAGVGGTGDDRGQDREESRLGRVAFFARGVRAASFPSQPREGPLGRPLGRFRLRVGPLARVGSRRFPPSAPVAGGGGDHDGGREPSRRRPGPRPDADARRASRPRGGAGVGRGLRAPPPEARSLLVGRGAGGVERRLGGNGRPPRPQNGMGAAKSDCCSPWRSPRRARRWC